MNGFVLFFLQHFNILVLFLLKSGLKPEQVKIKAHVLY